MRGFGLKKAEDQINHSSGQVHILSKGNRQRMPRIVPTGASDPCGTKSRTLLINITNIGVPLFH
jgi:hypothetical protein